MQIHNEEYYHIHRKNDPRWHVGNVIKFGQEENQFYAYYQSFHKAWPITISGSQHNVGDESIVELASKNLTDCAEAYRRLWQIAKEYSLYVREEIFEDIRAKEFQHLPSRKTCIWVCEKGQIDNWLGTFRVDTPKVFRLSLSGVIHKADEIYLKAELHPFKVIRENARKYWGTCQRYERPEFLFHGDVTILEDVTCFFAE